MLFFPGITKPVSTDGRQRADDLLPQAGLRRYPREVPDERERDLRSPQDRLLPLLPLERCGCLLPQHAERSQYHVQNENRERRR